MGFDSLEFFSFEAQRSVINNSLDDDIDVSTDAAEVPRSILFRYVNHEFQNSKLRTNVLR